MGVECSVFVVPFQFNADKQFAFPVDCHFIVFGQCLDQMICVDVATYFYAKVIDYEGKGDGSPNMSPKAWCKLTLVISCRHKSFR